MSIAQGASEFAAVGTPRRANTRGNELSNRAIVAQPASEPATGHATFPRELHQILIGGG